MSTPIVLPIPYIPIKEEGNTNSKFCTTIQTYEA